MKNFRMGFSFPATILTTLVLFAGLCITCLPATGQERDQLERDKRRIEQEIALINQMLRETQTTAELNTNQLVIINNRINSRQNLIRTLSNEINFINRRISNINKEVEELTIELEELRESYARMIYHAYKNRSAYQRMMFIFASQDFNQAYLRMKYLQQIAKHRQLQAQKIDETREKMEESRVELEEQKTQQQALLSEQQQEMQNLQKEQEQQNRNVSQLKAKERELMQELRAQEQAARQLQQVIERVIAEERRRAADAARAEGRAPTEAFRLTPEEQIISDRFADNRGKLPWPLERGIITGRFGNQPHPILPGITISNNGIDISTTQGSRARAIFEGTVSRVVSIPGAHNVVIIRHGEYRTVYANLAEVFVTNGQKVSIRQELGVVATQSNESQTQVHLEIWHESKKLNPEEWISQHR